MYVCILLCATLQYFLPVYYNHANVALLHYVRVEDTHFMFVINQSVNQVIFADIIAAILLVVMGDDVAILLVVMGCRLVCVCFCDWHVHLLSYPSVHLL